MSGSGQRRWLAVLIPAAILLVAIGCQKDPTPSQKKQIEEAIKVIEGIGPHAAEELRQMLASGRILVNHYRNPNVLGKCTHEQRIYGNDPNNTNVTTNGDVVHLSDTRCFTPGDPDTNDFKCKCRFVELTEALRHELEHAGQVVPRTKEDKIRNEKEAYRQSQRFLQEWERQLQRRQSHLALAASWAFLNECKDEDIKELLEKCLPPKFDAVGNILQFYEQWLAERNVALRGAMLADNPTKQETLGDDGSGNLIERMLVETNKNKVFVFNHDQGAYQILPLPTPFPTCVESLVGGRAFLVGNTNSLTNPQSAILTLFVSSAANGTYDQSMTLANLANVRFARNVLRYNGRLYVFDSVRQALFELLDTNHDGLPDTVSPSPSLQITPGTEAQAGFPDFPIRQVTEADGQIIGFSDTLTREQDPYSPIASWAETNGQFSFRGYRLWWQWGLAAPYPLHPLLRGTREVGVFGAPGNIVEFSETRSNGTEVLLGSTSLDSGGHGVLALAEAISNGGTYSLRDRGNGEVRSGLVSLPSRPFVTRIDPPSVEGLEGGQEIRLTGLSLNEIRSVSIEGRPAQILRQSKGELVMVAPPMDSDGHHEVSVVRGNDSFPAGKILYHMSSFPRMAILRPDLEEIIAARTGAQPAVTIQAYVGTDGTLLPLPGEIVELRDLDGNLVATTTTNASGLATFSTTVPPTGRVQFTLRARIATPRTDLDEFLFVR